MGSANDDSAIEDSDIKRSVIEAGLGADYNKAGLFSSASFLIATSRKSQLTPLLSQCSLIAWSFARIPSRARGSSPAMILRSPVRALRPPVDSVRTRKI